MSGGITFKAAISYFAAGTYVFLLGSLKHSLSRVTAAHQDRKVANA
jgi:hypothetical protein